MRFFFIGKEKIGKMYTFSDVFYYKRKEEENKFVKNQYRLHNNFKVS